MHLPSSVEPTVLELTSVFSKRTAARVAVLIVGMILSRGRHTIAAALRGVGSLAVGHFSSYHRVLSRAAWSPWVLGWTLAGRVIDLFPAGTLIPVAVDDTTAEHKGAKVYGKGCHRDAVRSSHTHTSYKWGHKWVVLSIVVKFPWARCPWSLPILAALYRPEKLDAAEGRRHKTPAQLARQLFAALIHGFPEQTFTLLGDGGFATMDLASFCARHRRHLVSRIRDDAALYAPPPARRRGAKGRPPVKGRKLPSPGTRAMRKDPTWQETTVDWYGGGRRRVGLLSDTGLWYNKGRAVPIRWVMVVDVDGTHRDDCVFSTDVSLSPAEIVSLFTRRWSIEVTFQEVRAHLGFETTRQWARRSVLRTAPCLLGLFSVVSLAFDTHLRRHKVRPAATAWYAKEALTFSDAISTIRQDLWRETIFGTSTFNTHITKLARPLRSLLFDALAHAA
jgi:hypothetical protein